MLTDFGLVASAARATIAEEREADVHQTVTAPDSGEDRLAWLGFGLELCAAGLSADEEAQLDEQSSAALASARQVQQFESRDGSTDEAKPNEFVWLGFGLELADADLTVEEEADLDTQSLAALASARMLRAREGLRRLAEHDFGLDPVVGLGEESELEAPPDALPGGRLGSRSVLYRDGDVDDEQGEDEGSDEQLAWLGFGLELCAAGLSADEEAQLDEQSRAALASARQVQQFESRDGSTDEAKPNEFVWLGFGLELADADLTVEEEADLDTQSLAALASARMLRAREGLRRLAEHDFGLDPVVGLGEESELEAPPDALPDGQLHGRRMPKKEPLPFLDFGLSIVPQGVASPGGQEAEPQKRSFERASSSEEEQLAWLGFGLELCAAGLSAEEEAQLDEQSRAALVSARQVREFSDVDAETGVDAGDKFMWLGFGLELNEAGLSTQDEAHLDAQSRAALACARLLQVRQNHRQGSWTGFGLQLLSAGLSAEEEAALDEQSRIALSAAREAYADCVPSAAMDTAWLSFGLELASSGLGAEEEAALDAQSRGALAAARVLSGPVQEAAAEPAWLSFGVELASAGLAPEEEAALDEQSRSALTAARLLAKVGKGAQVSSTWLGFGLELAAVGLSSEEEAGLDAHSRAALAAAKAASQAEKAAMLPMFRTAWLSFGVELLSAGLTSEEEAALDAQSRCALAVAKVVVRSAGADAALDTAWLSFGLELASSGLGAEEEAALDAQSRGALAAARVLSGPVQEAAAEPAWLSFGVELASAGLAPEEEAALDEQSRSALTAARLLAKVGKGAQASSTWLGFGLELAAVGLSSEEEAGLDAHSRAALAAAKAASQAEKAAMLPMFRTAWLSFGVELLSAGLTSEEEAALDAQSRCALQAALLPKVRSETTPGVPAAQFADISRSYAIKPPPAEVHTQPFAAGPSQGTHGSAHTWLSVGKELADRHLQPAAVAQLDSQARAALLAVRIVQARADTADEQYAWLGFGLELCAACLTAEEEARLDARSRAALENARVLQKETGREGRVASSGGASEEKEEQYAWLGFGLELADRGLSEEREAELDALAHAALSAARVLQERGAGGDQRTGGARLSTSERVQGREGEDGDASSLAFGFLLAELLTSGDEKKLDAVSHAALSQARVLQRDLHMQSTAHAQPGGTKLMAPDPRWQHGTKLVVKEVMPVASCGMSLSRLALETKPLYVGAVAEGAARTVTATPLQAKRLGAVAESEFDDAERIAFCKHLNWALGDDPDLAPVDPHSASALFGAIAHTPLLAKYIRHVNPESLDVRALNVAEPGFSLRGMHALQNHTLCLQAATAIGCGVRGLSPQQLATPWGSQQLVLQLLWNLIRTKLMAPLKPSDPAAQHVLRRTLSHPDEEERAFQGIRPEECLTRWVNHHIKRYIETTKAPIVPPAYRVDNLAADLATAVALSLLLHQVGLGTAPRPLHASTPHSRQPTRPSRPSTPHATHCCAGCTGR